MCARAVGIMELCCCRCYFHRPSCLSFRRWIFLLYFSAEHLTLARPFDVASRTARQERSGVGEVISPPAVICLAVLAILPLMYTLMQVLLRCENVVHPGLRTIHGPTTLTERTFFRCRDEAILIGLIFHTTRPSVGLAYGLCMCVCVYECFECAHANVCYVTVPKVLQGKLG